MQSPKLMSLLTDSSPHSLSFKITLEINKIIMVVAILYNFHITILRNPGAKTHRKLIQKKLVVQKIIIFSIWLRWF